MNDILPSQTSLWQHIEDCLSNILSDYGYREIRFPLLEKTELFKRSIGEVTDIVEKEMYTFDDRNGDSLTLRPEGTAGCVRSAIESGVINEGAQRLWYGGPMFRHERPQKGRYRQFHQIGAEAFGFDGPDIDAEMILINARFWKELGIKDVSLHLNSLGNIESRAKYKDALVEYFQTNIDQLDTDSQRRLYSNPLRILDSKNPDMQEIVRQAPRLSEYLDESSTQHFQGLCAQLDAAGINYVLNDKLVRGLDYYSNTVFEWITDQLGAQGTICAGGRYDSLVEWLGGKPCPAVGFAIGLERLVEMLSSQLEVEKTPHAYFVAVGDNVQAHVLALAEHMRNRLEGLRLTVHCGGGSFKSQFKKADRSGAQLAIVMGEDELSRQEVTIKFLRDKEADQQVVTHDNLPEHLATYFNLNIR
ncbi:MAG: histidine--tRNA ligase [Gammaproteobacteria bacterium]|nr:MAG: histidine--tRNA ligase [Gammaproteobacteria bacterium]